MMFVCGILDQITNPQKQQQSLWGYLLVADWLVWGQLVVQVQRQQHEMRCVRNFI